MRLHPSHATSDASPLAVLIESAPTGVPIPLLMSVALFRPSAMRDCSLAVSGRVRRAAGDQAIAAGTAATAGAAAGGVVVTGYGTVTVSQAGTILGGLIRVGGGTVGTQVIRFGADANQFNHAFRHVTSAGLNCAAVQAAIEADLAASSGVLSAGLNIRTVVVGGQEIIYNVFQLPNGVLNVGRITLPP
jgi:hypothetical protein